LSAVGAAIILLALPLDLFFQQLVQYPTVWVPVAPDATIARSTYYTPPDPLQIINGSVALDPDPLMLLVTQPFFYSNGTMPDLTSHCPTSNCTFEPFETLAVCGACTDASELLEFGCFESRGDWLTNFTTYYDTSVAPNITSCGYFLNASSDSPVLMSGYVLDPTTGEPSEALTMRWFPLIDASTKEPLYDGSVHFKDIINPIADFLVVGNADGAKAVYQNVTPAAQECYLTWCTQTLKSSLLWGQLSENVTYQFLNSTKIPYQYIFHTDPDTGIAEYDYFHNTTLVPPHQHLAPGQQDVTFGLDNVTFLSTSFMMDSVQLAFVTAADENTAPTYKYDNVVESRIRSLLATPWLPPNNISDHIQNVATAMTRVLRNTPAVNGTMDLVKGTSWESRVHVEIRWAWMTLPVALLLISLVFLLATMVKSTREEKDVGIWKTSALAILFNGLGEDVQRSVGPNCRMGQARAKARELRVKLLPE
jgi:hypothetical protein